MANVSSSNGLENRPKLRFKSDSGAFFPDWQRTVLSQIIVPHSEKCLVNMNMKYLPHRAKAFKDNLITSDQHNAMILMDIM